MVGELNYREAGESQWLASFQETSNRINRGRIYSQAASSSVSVDGPLWSPFDSLFPQIPAASHPWGGLEQMAATQSGLISTYNRPPQLQLSPASFSPTATPPPQLQLSPATANSAAFLGRRGLETQGQTFITAPGWQVEKHTSQGSGYAGRWKHGLPSADRSPHFLWNVKFSLRVEDGTGGRGENKNSERSLDRVSERASVHGKESRTRYLGL